MKMKKRLFMFMMAGLLSIGCALPVMASEIDEDSAGNVFASGDHVTLPGNSAFGVFAAGQDIDIDDLVASGSVFAAGQKVAVTGSKTDESLFAAGNEVTLNNADVHGNIFAAGNKVSMLGDTEANAVYAIASTFTFEGATSCLNVAAGHVELTGVVDGDVTISADSVDIGEGAVITGKLKIEGKKEPTIPESAQIGDYEFEKAEKNKDEDKEDSSPSLASGIFEKIKSCLYWMVAMAAFGMLLCWLFAHHIEESAVMIKQRTAPMIISGVVAWLCIPIACIMLCISMILAPTGGMIGVAYVLCICAGLTFTGCSLSRIVLPKMNIFLSSLIGIAVLEALRVVPVLGTLLGIAADIYLLGYVIQHVWANRLRKKES